jgi:hypothetical protein
MGAEQFEQHAGGETVAQAFDTAVKDAQYDYGHSGYSGTIAEKPGYHLIGVPVGFTHNDMIDAMSRALYGEEITPAWAAFIANVGESEAARVAEIFDEKWGPCIAMRMQGHPNRWCFAGYASS